MPKIRVSSALVATLALAGCGSSSTPPASNDAANTDTAQATVDGTSGTDVTSTTDAAMGADAGSTVDAVTETDTGVGTDTGVTDVGPPVTTPITATAETWTWVPFPTSQCGNGSPTGIGVNLTTRSHHVLIYLEGGGACWSALTCFTFQTAAHFNTGYGEADFATESNAENYIAEPGGMFDRTAAGNPFRDYSYVYVPYCTGDVHAGSVTQSFGSGSPAHFAGYANMGLYLARVVPTFPSADRVVIAGSSAGGFGALFNWYRTQQAFGSTRVDLIDDSGAPMPADVLLADGNIAHAALAWNLAANIPAGCSDCATNLDHAVGWLAGQFPTHRGALLQYQADTVLPGYFGISGMQFATGLNELLTQQFAPHGNMHSFVSPMAGHVLWFSPSLTVGSTTVQQFVTQMVTDDPTWGDVHP